MAAGVTVMEQIVPLRTHLCDPHPWGAQTLGLGVGGRLDGARAPIAHADPRQSEPRGSQPMSKTVTILTAAAIAVVAAPAGAQAAAYKGKTKGGTAITLSVSGK